MKPIAVFAGSLFILLLKPSTFFCQEAIPVSGGNISGSGGSASFTIGQVMFLDNQGNNGSVAEGVQQPWEISYVTGFSDTTSSLPQVKVFPNPVAGELTVQSSDLSNRKINYKLFDSQGHLISKQRLKETSTVISMSSLAAGTYFLYLFDNQKLIKVIKITKNTRP